MPVLELYKENLSEFIKSEALALGFFDCGVSTAGFMKEDSEFMEQWLEKGMQGSMQYLERNREKRYDVSLLVEGAKSVITVLYNYFPEEKWTEEARYKISKYAYGKDYHYVVKEKLKLLLEKIEARTGKRKVRLFTDSAPVLDRAYARKSGLGFIGKNTMLINRKGGSFFFIGHIIIDLELKTDTETTVNFCGSCTKCITACPTDALKPFELDARKCISYLTIENKDPEIPAEFNGKWKKWIVGCDICQDVCPWNRSSKPHKEPLFQMTETLKNIKDEAWENLDSSGYKKLFKETAVERTGLKGIQRNVLFLKNQQQPEI
ncbi:MAG: tRNA epoxyqueuosine(34) reductase QueG [Bacteroidales bacterium]|nr:tRNA epoxyqueuosine(34) reductase QueG [Bacteroidales bacterium]